MGEERRGGRCCSMGWIGGERRDGGGVVKWLYGKKDGCRRVAIQILGLFMWGLKGHSVTVVGIFDHLPSKRTLPKMSGFLQSGWCGQ